MSTGWGDPPAPEPAKPAGDPDAATPPKDGAAAGATGAAPAGGAGPLLAILIVVIVVLVLGGGGAAFFLLRSKPTPPGTDDPPVGTVASPAGPSSASPSPVEESPESKSESPSPEPPPAPPPPAQPKNLTAPKATGTTQVGSVLTTDSGTWQNQGSLSLAYGWARCESTSALSCQAIANASDPTYVISADDVGKQVVAQVTARNSANQTKPALSNFLGPVAAAPPVMVLVPQLVGGLYSDAKQLTDQLGLQLELLPARPEDPYADSCSTRTVLDQDPIYANPAPQLAKGESVKVHATRLPPKCRLWIREDSKPIRIGG